MENNIRIFDNPDFGNVRVIVENGKPLFCGSDVARALGYARPNNALNTHCKGDAPKRGITDSLGRTQEARFITEGDLYRLIVHSELPSAEKFERWIFDEVLPSIREHGGKNDAKTGTNDVTIMENPRFGKVRKVLVDGEWVYVASDVAKALEYTNPRKAVIDHCRCVTKRYIPHPQSPSKALEVSVIPKGDVLRLISESHLPAAQEFNHWLFDDVAVSVVDTGMYMSDNAMEKLLTDPDNFIALAIKWRDERKARLAAEQTVAHQQQKITLDAPKVLFADSVASSQSEILVGELAKILKQNGVEIGQNRLFAKLRQDGYLISRKGTDYNMPTQKSMESGLMRVKETVVVHSDGHTTISMTPKITGRGQVFFVGKYAAALH